MLKTRVKLYNILQLSTILFLVAIIVLSYLPSPIYGYVPGKHCVDAGGNCQNTCPSSLQLNEGCDGEGTYCCNYSICKDARNGPGNYCGGTNGVGGNPNTIYTCSETCTQGSGACIVTAIIATCTSSQHCSINSCQDNSSNNGNNTTSSDSPTNTPVPPTAIPPTNTPTPTIIPTATTVPPSVTPTGPIMTTASVTLHVVGIDVVNIPNIVPAPGKHGQSGWPFTMYIYTQNQSLSSPPYQIYTDMLQEIVDPSSPFYGFFQNTAFKLFDTHTGLPSGTYKFVVRTPMGSLRKQIGTGTFTISAWTSNILVAADPNNPNAQQIPQLIMGDLNGDNKVDLTDVSILIDCYGQKNNQNGCISDKNNIIQSFPSLFTDFLPGDLNDNGVVDGIDFTLLLKNFGLQGN